MSILKFHDFLKMKREQQGLKMAEFARQHKIPPANIYKWENGNGIRNSKLPSIIKSYKITPQEVIDYGLEPNNNYMPSIEKFKKLIDGYREKIDFSLCGESPFEKSLKNKAFTVLKSVEVQLDTIKIIDEVLEYNQ